MKDVKMGSGVGWGERARSERESGGEREVNESFLVRNRGTGEDRQK